VAFAEVVGDAEAVGELDEDKACAEPPAAGDDASDELDPLAAHAVRPVPATTTAMITAGTRRILMLLPSVE
jgi:hypothetical protein